MKLVEKQYQPPLHHITQVHWCKYKVEATEGSSKSKPNNLRKNVGEETRIQKLSQQIRSIDKQHEKKHSQEHTSRNLQINYMQIRELGLLHPQETSNSTQARYRYSFLSFLSLSKNSRSMRDSILFLMTTGFGRKRDCNCDVTSVTMVL